MIQEIIDIPYATDTRKERRKNNKNGKSTSEYFTPYSLIKKMADKTPRESWADTTKTFIDPCFGSGNILLYIIWNRIEHGIDWYTALSTCYGVELMSDNVQEAKDRIIELLKSLNIDFSEQEARDIMNHNLVCSDFFKWDFENWRPITDNSVELF